MRNLSIKLKLIILISLSLFLLSFTLGFISIEKTKETLIQQEYKALTSVRDAKIKQLKDIFALYTKQVELLSNISYVTNLTKELKNIHKELGIDEYGKFPIDSLKVKKSLEKWDPFFKSYTDTYPFEDVLIIDEKYGHVMYSFLKENDYGENLLHGKYRKSNLAQIWEKVRRYKKTVFIDMKAYEARNGKPTMFLASPVFINKKLESILVLEIDNASIANIMQFRSGYGKTQEDYLAGSDYLMRSDSYLNPQTHSLEKSFSNPESGSVKTEAVIEAFKGISATKITRDYRNSEVLSSYTKFDIDEELSWAVISEIDLNEILAKPNELRDTLALIAISSFIFIMILLYLVIQKYIINSLNEFQDSLLNFFKYLNRETKEVEFLTIKNKDEIGVMSKAVNSGIKKTQENIIKADRENWIKEGINKLNQELLNINDIQKVSSKTINFLCNYINAGVGVFYAKDEYENKLTQIASYAHVVRDELSNEFKIGEGIIGQVALQKSPILLKNIKKDEALITSGIMTQSSSNTYTFPLLYNNELFGVIEIGSFNEFNQEAIEFLDSINETISIALSIAIQNNKVQELLQNTKKSNEILEQKQKELQDANELMIEQQQQLEEANANMEEQQQQLEEANANMEEQQQQLKISEQNLKLQNQQLEESKKDIQKKAEELSISGKYKSEFLANMSHELRTPLNSIILLSSLLEKNSKKTLNNDDIKKAKTIFESGNELLRLINDILDLSKIESGKMSVIVDKFESYDLLKLE